MDEKSILKKMVMQHQDDIQELIKRVDALETYNKVLEMQLEDAAKTLKEELEGINK